MKQKCNHCENGITTLNVYCSQCESIDFVSAHLKIDEKIQALNERIDKLRDFARNGLIAKYGNDLTIKESIAILVKVLDEI